MVYVGPLIASKKEEERGEGDGRLDAVLTFAELRDLFSEFRIEEKQLEFSEFDHPHGNMGALFPIAGGIVQAAALNDGLLSGNVTTVEGELELKEALREFEDSIGTINSHFNLFYTEYLMGPGTTRGGKKYIRQASVKIYARKRMKSLNVKQWEKDMEIFAALDFHRSFTPDDQRLPAPSEERIAEIMQEMKKDFNEDIGCGACGYNSCRDFAIAIAKGLAIPEMCNSYTTRNRQDYIQSLKISNEKLAMAEKALRDSELVARKEKEAAREASEIITAMLQKLPSGLVILDEKMKVLQANQSFITMLGEDAAEINEVIPGLAGADLKTLLPYTIYNLFSFVLTNNDNIQNRDITFRGKLLNLSVFVIRKGKIAGGIFRDMYSPEVRKEEVLNRISEVIDKNLSLVQQIGFLLGEGASETERMLHSIIEFYKDQAPKAERVMQEPFHIEVHCAQKNYGEERICGDVFLTRKVLEENRTIVVLSDGMGHGVKANVLATLTSTMALNFTLEHKEPEKIAEIIMNTLPVCSVRKMNYATFTIIDIESDGEVSILEYDNPQAVIFRGNKVFDPHWSCIIMQSEKNAGKEIKMCRFRPQKEDRIMVCSDGISQAGMGSDQYPFGWGISNARDYVVRLITSNPDLSARRLGNKVVTMAHKIDGYFSRDDTSCAMVYFREPRKLLVCTGPPYEKDKDPVLAKAVNGFQGKIIISGATTADIVSRELGRKIEDSSVSTIPTCRRSRTWKASTWSPKAS